MNEFGIFIYRIVSYVLESVHSTAYRAVAWVRSVSMCAWRSGMSVCVCVRQRTQQPTTDDADNDDGQKKTNNEREYHRNQHKMNIQ